ncbi:MAG TPA: peptidase M23, partial [Alcanivorax sp.]|nr:peptidase M23 [Alcanivorax sp.]
RLEAEQAELAEEKKVQLRWLVKTVRASYQSGREERLKLMLNQQEPDQIARLLRYQEYFQRARTDRL